MGELLSTVERVHKALLEDKFYKTLEINLADTANLLSILGEIEKCTSWNMFDVRETSEIVNSIDNMLLMHDIYDLNGVESANWDNKEA